MMDWIQILSYLFTNEVRLLLGLYLVSKLTDFSLERKALLLAGRMPCYCPASNITAFHRRDSR